MTVDLDVVTRMASTYASHAYQARPRAEDLQPLGAVYEEVVAPLLARAGCDPRGSGGPGPGEQALDQARREGAEQALTAVWRFVLDQQCRPGGCQRGELRNWLRARLRESGAERPALDDGPQRLDRIRCLTEDWEHPRVGHGACEYARSVREILDARPARERS